MSSTQPVQKISGMGDLPHEAGVAFRVWAPNAQKVFVMGTFNDFSEESHPMESEDGGTWYVNVPEAKIGQEYRYLIINGDQRHSRMDPRAREVTNSIGNGVIHDPNFDWGEDDYEMPPWNEAVIYELHIGTFGESKFDDRPATFGEAAKHFDHLKRLGVNVIQIMPVAEFAGDYSWGYNPSQMFAIETAYGGPPAFKKFIKCAHAAGFAVIIDVVYNHAGPSDLDMWQFDGWSENDMGGIYFYNDWRANTPWGQSRLDYGRGEVRTFIRDNALMWLKEYHVDGLRWDATAFIRNVNGFDNDPGGDLPDGWTLMQYVNREVHKEVPNALSIAEDLQGNPWITKEDGAGGAGFGSQWDAKFVHPIRQAVIAPEDTARSLAEVCDAVNMRYEDDAFSRVIYSESHDEVANGKQRIISEINANEPYNWFSIKRSTLAATLVFTSPGIPMIFQGQEFLEGEWFRDTVPVDWDNAKEFKGIILMYRDLARLRRNLSGVTAGLTGQGLHCFHTNESEKVIAFHRWKEGGPKDDVVVISNFANVGYDSYRIGFPSEGRWIVRFNSDWEGYNPYFHNTLGYDTDAVAGDCDGKPAHGNVGIGPYSTLILSKDA